MQLRNKDIINEVFENKPELTAVFLDIVKFFNCTQEFRLFTAALAKNTNITYLKIPSMHASMSYHDILPNLAEALKFNTSIQILELNGCFALRDAKLIAGIVKENQIIKKLTIKNINEGLDIITDALKKNDSITHLNCELGAFNDKEATLLLNLVKSNPRIVELKLTPACYSNPVLPIGHDQYIISKKLLDKISEALESNKKRLTKNNSASFFQPKESKSENTIEKDLKDLISKLWTINIEKNQAVDNGKIWALGYLDYQLEKNPGEYIESLRETMDLCSETFKDLPKDDPITQLLNRVKNAELPRTKLYNN